MATTTRTSRTRTADADTAPKGLPRDLDESDVIADGQRMADELAAREAAKPAQRRSRKAAPAQPAAPAETAPEAAPAAAKASTRKGSGKAAPAQPQPPAQPVEAEAAEGDKKPQTPRLNQADMIVAFLAAHPGESFSPNAISKAITPEGRKPLGLRDACARLAKADKIAQTSDKPVQYAAK